MSPARRRQMVDLENPKLPKVRQCTLLGVSRSSIYYRPRAASQEDLSLMGEIDRQYLETPFYGSRRMNTWLERCGVRTGKPEAGAMVDARHGAAAHLPPAWHQPKVAGAPGLPLPAAECQDHPAQPSVGRRHHLPTHGPGFPLPGGGDGLAQPVRAAWRLSSTLEAGFCAESLEEALARGASSPVGS